MGKPYPDNSLLVNHNCLGMVGLMSDFIMGGYVPAAEPVSATEAIKRSINKEKTKPGLPFKPGDNCLFLGKPVYVIESLWTHRDPCVHIAWWDSLGHFMDRFLTHHEIALLKKIDPKEEAKQEPKDPLKSFIQYTGTKWASITREELQSRLDDLWSHASVQLSTDYNRGRYDAITDLAKRLGIELREE